VNTIIALSNKYKSWISAAQFGLDTFLQSILQPVITTDTAIIEIGDDSETFFTSDTQLEPSELFRTDTISFKFRDWSIKTTLSAKQQRQYNTNSSLIVTVVLSCILVIIFIVVVMLTYVVKIQAANENHYLTEMIHNSHNIVIHEIRNILNSVYMLFQLKELGKRITDKDIDIARTGVDNIIDLLSNILDYQKLLQGSYVPDIVKVKPVEILKDIIGKYPFINIDLECSGDIGACIDIDKLKFTELIQNGINNSVKFASGNSIIIRIQ